MPARPRSVPLVARAASRAPPVSGALATSVPDIIEIFADVELQEPGAAPGELPSPIDRRQAVLTAPAGERVGGQEAIEDELTHQGHGVVQDPIAKARGRNEPLFRVEDRELVVGADCIGPLFHVTCQHSQVLFEPAGERRRVAIGSLAAGCAGVCLTQNFPLPHPFHQLAGPRHASHPGGPTGNSEDDPSAQPLWLVMVSAALKPVVQLSAPTRPRYHDVCCVWPRSATFRI
jgi:hypothetical protein